MFYVNGRTANGKGLVRVEDFSRTLWEHWMGCDRCGDKMEDIDHWRWYGDSTVEIVFDDVDVGEVTGLEMLEVLKQRFRFRLH